METPIPSIDAEPPLIARVRSAVNTAKRTVWLWKKLAKPLGSRLAHVGLAGMLIVGFNPFTSAHALAASDLGAETPTLADFSFSHVEEVSLSDELAHLQADGFAPKPVVVTTEMGRPEREQRERERQAQLAAAAAAAAQAKAARAQADRIVRTTTSSSASEETLVAVSSTGNTYAYGYCTWWAKAKRPDLPNQLGNGGMWLRNARAMGLTTGSEARAGAIVVTSEGPIGHVGYVEAIEGDDMTVSDMNMIGWGKVSRRQMSTSAGVIEGFIY